MLMLEFVYASFNKRLLRQSGFPLGRQTGSLWQGAGGSNKHAMPPYWEWAFLTLLLLFVIAVRTRLLSFPLERDEGEYAYMGQLIQHGFAPYGLAYNMKLPGTYFVYALVMSALGQTTEAVHLGLIAVNCLTVLLIYKIGKKAMSPLTGAAAACSYAFLSVSSSVLGVMAKFWFFTFVYALEYGSQVPLWHAPAVFMSTFPGVVGDWLLLWFVGAAGAIAFLLDRRFAGRRVYGLLFGLTSALSVCPGFYFRPHYFVTLLPAVSLSAGVFIAWAHGRCVRALGPDFSTSVGRLVRSLPLAVFTLSLGVGVLLQRDYLFTQDPQTVARAIYGANPFQESVEIGRFLERNSAPSDKIAVLGSEPQIYFYSRRLSDTGYIYLYPLMEGHPYALAMQEEMAREIERSKPRFVYAAVETSWAPGPQSETFILRWSEAFLRQNYVPVGIADILPEGTVYKWNEEARGYFPRSSASVLVFERAKDGASPAG